MVWVTIARLPPKARSVLMLSATIGYFSKPVERVEHDHPKAGKMVAAAFLRNLIAAVPYRIHTVLTGNGIQFTNHERHRYAFEHIFDLVCREHLIEHRHTKIKHALTNGQVERLPLTVWLANRRRALERDNQGGDRQTLPL